MFPRTQMSILQAMEAVMGLTFLLATRLSPSPFLAELMFCPRARAGRIGALLSVNPQGQSQASQCPGKDVPPGRWLCPGKKQKHRASQPPSSFSGSCPMKQMLGSSGAGTLRSSPPLANPPGGWCTRRGNGLDGDNWSQMPQGHHQPVLDWPPSVLPAMWENVFLIIL